MLVEGGCTSTRSTRRVAAPSPAPPESPAAGATDAPVDVALAAWVFLMFSKVFLMFSKIRAAFAGRALDALGV